MIYKDFQGEQLSHLGMGLMRLPVIDGDDARIDEQAAFEMVDYAYHHGVNYFDTAWGYHGGNSELVAGRALARYPRDSFNLTSKFPGYDISNFGKHEEIFERQLAKLQVDHLDFYLIHNLCELNVEQYLDDDRFGTVSYFVEQKKAGRIRHLGFSSHAGFDAFKRYLDKFGDVMEFCQLQLNYMDWNFQDAKRKVDYLNELGIPVWVMEPLRGGHLCSFAEEDAATLAALRPEASAIEWAFRFLQSVPGVAVVLTGASSLEQLKQNVAMFDEDKPLSADEMEAILSVGRKLGSAGTLACTSCHYCVSHCPQELDIPYLISLYNEHISKGDEGGFIAPMALGVLPVEKHPSACIGCQSCEAVCPQQLPIAEAFARFAELLAKPAW